MKPTAVINHLEQFIALTADERQLFDDKFAQRKVKRKEKLLKEGEVCKHYSFIISGCFRMYGVDERGYEHNIQFACENDWIMDIGSFHTKKPSKLFIESIEPSVVLQIEQKDLYFLYLNIPKLDRIFKVLIENKYVELQERVLQNFSSTAQQRYLAFLEQYPMLSNRLPNIHIASYLGITPEFLSKVRNDLSKR